MITADVKRSIAKLAPRIAQDAALPADLIERALLSVVSGNETPGFEYFTIDNIEGIRVWMGLGAKYYRLKIES